MADEQYLNSITMEYLLNPVLHNKINTKQNVRDVGLINDILFYRRRISQLTKQMCKGEFENTAVKTAFLSYASCLVYNLKQQDEKDIFQKEYENLSTIELNQDGAEDLENSAEIIDSSNNLGNDFIMNKVNNDYKLDRFVTRKNIKEIERVLPRERIADISDPQLKRKGLKKKNVR